LQQGRRPLVAVVGQPPKAALDDGREIRAERWIGLCHGDGDAIDREREPKRFDVNQHHEHAAQRVEATNQSKVVYPRGSTAPLPNQDLPADVLRDYKEARDILPASARGAAALLRLAIQRLCAHAGESGKDLNADIASLVKKGLRPQLQKALDVVRVVGNNAVHPGQIDFDDNPEIAAALFGLVNLIAQQIITEPKEADALFKSLPVAQRESIEKRDK
jgi:hypothetical protein